MLGGQTGPFLKKLVVGNESANNVYLEKVDVYNMYAMSESGLGRQGDGSIVPLSPPLASPCLMLINDCTRGYAIFAEKMLEIAQNVAEENLKEAS